MQKKEAGVLLHRLLFLHLQLLLKPMPSSCIISWAFLLGLPRWYST